MRDHRLYLSDIVQAMESIEAFVQGMSFEEFQADDKTASAVVRKFEIVGEATKQLPEKIRQNHPEVPWKLMAGMRDRLIHVYFGVAFPLVWSTIKEDIPRIKPQARKILAKMQQEG